MSTHTITLALYASLVTAALVIIVLLVPRNTILRAYIWWHELILGTLPAESAGLRYAKAGLREAQLRTGIARARKQHALLDRQARGLEDALLSLKHLERHEPVDNYTLLDYLAAMSTMDRIAQMVYKTPVDKEMDL